MKNSESDKLSAQRKSLRIRCQKDIKPSKKRLSYTLILMRGNHASTALPKKKPSIVVNQSEPWKAVKPKTCRNKNQWSLAGSKTVAAY